jgi:hypothetical protein
VGTSLGISLTEEAHGDATIYILDLSGISLPEGTVALGEPIPAGLRIGIAATEKVVVIGSSPEFVKAVLDAGPASSLASNSRFAAALKDVGPEQGGLAWVDLAGMRGTALAMIPDSVSDADRETVAAWAEGLDSILAVVERGTTLDGATVIIRVQQP